MIHSSLNVHRIWGRPAQSRPEYGYIIVHHRTGCQSNCSLRSSANLKVQSIISVGSKMQEPLDSSITSIAPPSVPNSSRPASPGWLPALLVGLAYPLFWQIAPRIHTEAIGAIIFSTFVSLGLVIWFAAEVGRACVTTRAALISTLVSSAIILPLRVLAAVRPNHIPPPWSLALYIPGLPDLLFVWFAGSLGSLLSRIIRSANLIPPVAIMLALVDIWTVLLGGPVQTLMTSKNPVAQLVTQSMTVKLPAPTPLHGATPVNTQIGFADFLFVAFFSASITRFVGRPRVHRRMVIVMISALCLYMLPVIILAWSLPALVPMSVVMLALHWRYFQYERSEAFALLYAGLLVAAIAFGFWFFSKRSPQPESKDPDSGPHANLGVHAHSIFES